MDEEVDVVNFGVVVGVGKEFVRLVEEFGLVLEGVDYELVVDVVEVLGEVLWLFEVVDFKDEVWGDVLRLYWSKVNVEYFCFGMFIS